MSRKDAEKDFTKQNGIFSFETKEKMPIKGLEKGDGVWGRGKEPFLKKVFPSSPSPIINLYREQSLIFAGLL